MAEEVGFGTEPTSEGEAERAFAAATAGDPEAYKRLYVAIFEASLLQCQDLQVPVHLHSGMCGMLWDGPVSNADPFLLVPLIRRPRFLAARVVLVHGGYPWIRHAAAVAHALPHVWIDLSWTIPWNSLGIVECLREMVSIAPISKLLVGSASHGTPEVAWLSAITAKIGLAKTLSDAVTLGLLTEVQARQAGRMVLHDNAARLYRLGC